MSQEDLGTKTNIELDSNTNTEYIHTHYLTVGTAIIV